MESTFKQAQGFKDMIATLESKIIQSQSPDDARLLDSIQPCVFQMDHLIYNLWTIKANPLQKKFYPVITLILTEQIKIYSQMQNQANVRNLSLTSVFNICSKKYRNSHNEILLECKFSLFLKTLSNAIACCNFKEKKSLNFVESSVQIMRFYDQNQLAEVADMLSSDFLENDLSGALGPGQAHLKDQLLNQQVNNNGKSSPESSSKGTCSTGAISKSNRLLELGLRCEKFAVFITAAVLGPAFQTQLKVTKKFNLLTTWLEVIIFWIENFQSPTRDAFGSVSPHSSVNSSSGDGSMSDYKFTKFLYHLIIAESNNFKNLHFRNFRREILEGGGEVEDLASLCPLFQMMNFVVVLGPEVQNSGRGGEEFENAVARLHYLLLSSISRTLQNLSLSRPNTMVASNLSENYPLISTRNFEKLIANFVEISDKLENNICETSISRLAQISCCCLGVHKESLRALPPGGPPRKEVLFNSGEVSRLLKRLPVENEVIRVCVEEFDRA